MTLIHRYGEAIAAIVSRLPKVRNSISASRKSEANRCYQLRMLWQLIVIACSCSMTFVQADAQGVPVPQPMLPNLLAARATPVRIEVADKILRARAKRFIHSGPSPAKRQKRVQAGRARTLAGLRAGLVACSGTGQPTEIATLAASLKCDPDLIFEYVYNNVEYEPLYGSNKGALGTLLDLRGNDIDQAQLFVALLEAAGVPSTSINYIYGYVRLTGAQAASWLGVKNDAAAIGGLLANGGIPFANLTPTSGTLNRVDVAQVWVQLQIGATNYLFDPSFKQHTVTLGLNNLGSIMGYSQSQFLTDAGGIVNSPGTDWISNINRANARNDLTHYANNLAAYIQGQSPALSMADVVGGKTIQYLIGSPLRQTALPILSPSQPAGFPQNWGSAVPNAYRTCFTISMPGVPAQTCSTATPQTISFYADETYGHRITVFSTGAGCASPSGSCTPTLLIDGVPPASGQNTGTAANYGTPWSTLNISITHPYTGSLATAANQHKAIALTAGGSYLVGAGWGQVGRGMVEKHRSLLAQALKSGAPPSSEAVLGESLSVISYSWLAEVAYEQRLGDMIAQQSSTITKATTQYHHGVGIAGQSAIDKNGNQGPYVDLPMNFETIQPQTSTSGTGLPPLLLGRFFGDAGVSSSLESAVLEQTQAFVAGAQAASTVRIVDMNAATGAKTYRADGTTKTGITDYFANIKPSLVGYSSGDLQSIASAISTTGTASGNPTGNRVLIPTNGSVAVGTVPWTGAGYTIFAITTNTASALQKISGGLSGGYLGNNTPPETVTASSAQNTVAWSGSPSIPAGVLPKMPAATDYKVSEPVDGITGTYLYSHTDLATGSGAAPYALALSRQYSSSSNTTDVGVGNGWTHNYNISISRLSDPYASMGDGSPISAAAAIAAIYVAQDLLAAARNAQNMTIAWMVDRWMTDQLTNNAVILSWGTTNEEYTIQPHADGSATATYLSPNSSSAVVTGSAPDTYGNYTTFVYRGKDQSQISFNALDASLTGKIASWTTPNGVNLAFAYGSPCSTANDLCSVSNNLGRRIALSYTGPHVTSATDDTGRSVSYSYDANNNLVRFTDLLNFLTTYAYDGAASHLTQVFYPSNPTNAFVTNTYDALGKVTQQANANGNVSSFYLAGSRSELIDAVGNRHITYQTPRGKVLKDDWVLSGSANIFNDTAQQNGLVNVTTNQYDGLDRLAAVIAPEGGKTAYNYSADLLGNVTSIVLTPKAGSPLSALTTSYTYDPVYNKPTSITDPLGIVSTSSYDPATGNLVQSIADTGGGSHFNARTSFTYNAFGQALTATDPMGVVTQYAYDAFGNQTSITQDLGHLNLTTAFGYNGLGDVTSVTDPKGNTTRSVFDADRRLATVTTPAVVAAPAGLVTSLSYDPDGHVLQTQQSSNGTVLRTTSATYTLTGQSATATDARGNVTKFAYDADDRLASTTDPMGNVTSYAYDAMSRRISLSNVAIQAGPLLQWAYTPDGLSASLTDAANHATTFAYDGFDRLSTTTYPDSSSDKETLSYDADSNVVSLVTRKGDTIAYSYDTLNRRCTKTIAATAVACGGSSANPTTLYSYDLNGRLIAANDNGPAVAAITGSSASFSQSVSYDPLNRPTAITWTPAAAQTTPTAANAMVGYSYDANNRRISETPMDVSWSSIPSTSKSVNYTANALNQYTAVGAVTPAYDGNGNLASDGTFTYCYDAESRLAGILSAGTCAAPTTMVASYAYDAQGRRKAKTLGSVKTVFVTDAAGREILEYNGTTGAVNAWYAYGLGSNEVLNRMNVAAGTRQTLIPDILGSIIGTVDSGTGAVTKTGYQAFGENPSLTSGTFNYTAQRFDAETAGSTAEPSGLYYYRARMYSPVLGRFLQPDPVGYAGGVNLYAYVGNSPVNGTDPSGKCGPLLPLCIWAGETIVDTAPIWGPVVTKAVVGFGLGYYGAKLGGVRSTEGQVASGLVGALAVPGTSSLIQTAARAGYAGWGTFGVGASGSFLGGSGSNIAGQYGDLQTGHSSQIDLGASLKAGLTTTAAFTLFGEGALAAAAVDVPGATGVAIDTITGTGSSMGGYGLDKLFNGQSDPSNSSGSTLSSNASTPRK